MALQLNGTDGVTFNDGSEQWAAASPIGTKNLIINGNMQIAQRGTSSSSITTSGYTTVDRWTNSIGTAGTWTISQDTDVPTGQGFSNSHKYDCTTANGSLSAGSELAIIQMIEAQNLQHLKFGTSSAETLTVSFWVKSNKTGTYIVEIYQWDSNRAISKSYTINSADTWEKKTITIEGDTSGQIDNNNDRGFQVAWWIAAGSNNTSGTLQTSWGTLTSANRAVGQVNLADSTSNYINITGVQLEVGDTATPFEVMPYDMQLARCQRYYTNVIHLQWCGAVYTPNGDTRTQVLPIGTMRASPTLNPSSYSAHSINLGANGNAVNTPTATWNLSVVHAGNNHYSIDTNQNGTVSYASATSVAIVGPHGAGTITCDAEL